MKMVESRENAIKLISFSRVDGCSQRLNIRSSEFISLVHATNVVHAIAVDDDDNDNVDNDTTHGIALNMFHRKDVHALK